MIVGLVVEVFDVEELVRGGFFPASDSIKALHKDSLFFGNFHRFFLCTGNISIIDFGVGFGNALSLEVCSIVGKALSSPHSIIFNLYLILLYY